MSSIAEWVRTLIVVVLLGNLVEFLLPKSDMKRYAGLVVGLVILAVMLAPVSRWVSALEHAGTPLALESWTNTGPGFRQVTINEELHQAEAIVLTYPGGSSMPDYRNGNRAISRDHRRRRVGTALDATAVCG